MLVFFNSNFRFNFYVENCCSKVFLLLLYTQNCKSYGRFSVLEQNRYTWAKRRMKRQKTPMKCHKGVNEAAKNTNDAAKKNNEAPQRGQ